MRVIEDVSAGLATLLAGAVAAGCAHAPPAQVEEPFRAFECPADGTSEAAAFGAVLTLAFEVDYLEVVSHGGGHRDVTVAERGVKCGGARDGAACRDELARRRRAWVDAQPECTECRGSVVVLTTHGDTVAHWSLAREVVDLLGAVDSPADAWLVLMVRDGLPPFACGDAEASGYRVVGKRVEIARQEWVSTCRPVEKVEIVAAVDRAGNVEEVSRRVVEREDEGCFKP